MGEARPTADARVAYDRDPADVDAIVWLGRDADAARVLEPIDRDMRIRENHSYHGRLLMYAGEVSRRVLDVAYRPAFGHIAAEADLARMKRDTES